jgi:hypothetical protein
MERMEKLRKTGKGREQVMTLVKKITLLTRNKGSLGLTFCSPVSNLPAPQLLSYKLDYKVMSF